MPRLSDQEKFRRLMAEAVPIARRLYAWHRKELDKLSQEIQALQAAKIRELERRLAAQGTEARRAETENTGSVHDGPVGEADAPR